MEAEALEVRVEKGNRRKGKGTLLGGVRGETRLHGALVFTVLPSYNKIVGLESSLWSDCSNHMSVTV